MVDACFGEVATRDGAGVDDGGTGRDGADADWSGADADMDVEQECEERRLWNGGRSSGGGSDPAERAGDGASWVAEMRHLARLAAPMVVQMATQQGMVVTDQVMVGHLGAEKLAAASLGNTWFNFWFYFLMGVSTALDTLCSQAHGANNSQAFWKAVGSSLLILNLLAVIMGVGLWFSSYVVEHLFMQTSSVSEASGMFCKWLIPGLWPLMIGLVATKVLQTRSIMVPSAIIGVVAFIANIFFNWWFIDMLGFIGSPIATTTSRLLQMVLTVAYVIYETKNTGTDSGDRVSSLLSGLSIKSLRLFLALGLPGGFMMGMEASSFDITTALAARLGTVAVDAHTILLSIVAFMFLAFPFGMSIASTVRVGSLLGAGHHRTARISGILTFISCAAFMSAASVLLYALRFEVGGLFVDDPRVETVVAEIAPIVVPAQVFDGLNGAGQGVLRGMGKQNLILLINIVGFWGCGLIPGYLLTFNLGLGLNGLWYGIAGACTVAGMLSLVYFLCTDMARHAALTVARIKALGSSDDLSDGCSESACRLPSNMKRHEGSPSSKSGDEDADEMELSLIHEQSGSVTLSTEVA